MSTMAFPPSASRSVRILSSVVYRLPLMPGSSFLMTQTNISPGSEKRSHVKIMVIDGQVLITGSFNFTKAAEEKNAENLLIIRDKELATAYIANWHLHEAHSELYHRKTR